MVARCERHFGGALPPCPDGMDCLPEPCDWPAALEHPFPPHHY